MIIPAYENWTTLDRTLAGALRACRRARRPFEVLVADNGSGSAFSRALGRLSVREPAVRHLRRSARHAPFRPGDARNRGIAAAQHACLVFIDADCIPTPGLIARYAALADARRDTAFVGHRVFIDGSDLVPAGIERGDGSLERAPLIASRSNYGETRDRRLDRLPQLARDPHAYDCLYACNFALHRDCLGEHRFEPVFDGSWGYEDVELGYRLQRAGRRFEYVPEAFVYHQESYQQRPDERATGRARNFQIASQMIPGFAEHRARSGRWWAIPPEVRPGLASLIEPAAAAVRGPTPSR